MSCEQRRCKWRCGVTGAMLVGLPLSLLGLATFLGRRGTASAPGLCSTTACRSAAMALNISLSHSIGPCQDLEHFVCDGWPHIERAGARVKLIMNYAWSAYRVPKRSQSAVDKVVALYQSCVASLSPGGGERSTLRAFIVQLGLGPANASMGSAFRALLRLSTRHAMYLLLAVQYNVHNASAGVTVRPAHPPPTNSSPGYVLQVAEMALLDDPETVAHDLKLIEGELRAAPAAQHVTRTVPLEVIAEECGTLSDLLIELPGTNSHTPVDVEGPMAVRWYANFLRRHRGEPALRRYVAWHTARVFGSLTQYDMFRATLEENQLGRLEPSPSLIKTTCLAQAANLMPLAYNAFVVRHFATHHTRRAVESIADGLRAAAITSVRASHWMSDRPKAMATLKLRKLAWILPRHRSEAQVNHIYARVSDLGLKDFLKSYINVTEHSGHRDTHEANQAAVDVAYSAQRNIITVSAGILNTPYFEDTLPAAFNYAGLGQRMALELLHTFDELGRWYDARGRKINWWDDATADEFRNRLECRHGGGEALMESSALRLAFQAFRRTHQHVLLKGLEVYTPEQIFFISSCHKWCGHENSYCNAAVRNLEEFSAAFKCKPGDLMSPHERCPLLV
ncbi:hypothetical protein HPB51_013985 [Rhipicephalus microplus]|uniref:M13 family peptidase n=1 Tax=Rhipicephalus microplus TaxID=6941 RepID=A0A9J6DA35_RHIMP|nr:endothelin-converting enzyme 1-like [Rhipicephalus microplus]KAH8018919.1 hypothetical protein HPB51_013985 [Rhipicephalus microplus]